MPAVIGTIAAYVVTLDERLTVFLLLVNAFVALAVTVLATRKLRPLEFLAVFALSWLLLLTLSSVFVQWGMDRPFFTLEIVRISGS